MKQKLFTLLLAVAASVGTMFASTKIGDLYYNLDATNQTAEVAINSSASGEIIIPSSVTYNSVSYSVTSIGEGAFWGCTSLTSVTIPNSVTSIGYNAFYQCTGLTSVTIPNSVTSIGDRAFRDCSGLTSVTIGNSVTSIGNYAFCRCSGLTSVTIGNSVTSIGDYAFRDCSSLTSVTIPNSVTSIGGKVFYECVGLTSVTIPNSVTGIGDEAFNHTGLTSVTIEAEIPPTLGNRAFSGTNDYPIYVPCSTLDAYKTAWSNYASRIQYGPLEYHITGNVNIEGSGNVQLPQNKCEDVISAAPNYGYHFVRWNDGNTDNPRTIVLIQDTTFTAEFVKNTYTITTKSSNPQWGTTAGDNSALYLDKVEISATANYGYHFVKWNDNNTSNPRTISVTEDKTYTASFAKNVYTITLNNAEHGSISGNTSAKYLDEVTLTANPDYGYHFTQWSDGVKDNPRTIVLTQDTTFTAEFAKNTYTISTTSANPEWGTTAGDTAALYLDEVEISAIPNYGYHFVRWNDNNRSNPRTVSVTEDKTFIATFAKNVYYITKNAEHGTISGNSSAEYLDFVTLTVTPDYGYHFTQWSDGLKDNPRIAQITQDTTFTAEFAYDRVGTCGKDLALVWSYDPTNKVLTIGNAGSFTENMEFGVEAPTEMEELVIGNSVTAIGENAFAGIETLKKIIIGESVKTIGEQAFFNCVNLETIFNYRPTPTNTYSNAFDGVDKFECALYVLSSSIDMYKNASVWRDFYYTYAIGAEEATVTTNDVQVEPQDNAVTVTWPTSENAASYTIQITKDGVLFCTLIFNANGQLIGIAFAPSRDGQAHAPAAIMTANGWQFTITGLNSGTHYDLTLQAKDSQNAVLASYSSTFTTTGESQGIEDVQGNNAQCTKVVRDGQIFILRGEKVYNAQGALVK